MSFLGYDGIVVQLSDSEICRIDFIIGFRWIENAPIDTLIIDNNR